MKGFIEEVKFFVMETADPQTLCERVNLVFMNSK